MRTALESATNYIFLDFQFDKWYIQLILSLLKLNDKQYNFIRYASANAISNDVKSLCINHYRIQFVDADNSVFINTLHDKCKEAGLLRDFSSIQGVNFMDEKEKDLRENIDRENKLLQGMNNCRTMKKIPLSKWILGIILKPSVKRSPSMKRNLSQFFRLNHKRHHLSSNEH